MHETVVVEATNPVDLKNVIQIMRAGKRSPSYRRKMKIYETCIMQWSFEAWLLTYEFSNGEYNKSPDFYNFIIHGSRLFGGNNPHH